MSDLEKRIWKMFEQFGNFAIDLTIIQDILRNLELFDRMDYRDE